MSTTDSSIFNQRDNGHLINILEYVDDIIITGTNSQYAFSLISTLGLKFFIKDLGSLNYILGTIQVQKDGDSTLILHQYKYAHD